MVIRLGTRRKGGVDKMNWSIIIFCYNEEQSIEKVITQSINFINSVGSHSEIIIVNDGSTDNSGNIINEWAVKDNRIRVINHLKNKGIGAALKTGYSSASKTYVCAIPADGQFNLEELKKISPFSNKYFYSLYREEKNYDNYRNLLSNFNNWLNKIGFNNHLKDVNWIKVYRKEQLAVANPQLRSSLIESEISSKLLKKQIKCIELVSEYLPREAGMPKGGSIVTVSRALLEMFRLIVIVKRF